MTIKSDYYKYCPTLRGFITSENGQVYINVFCPFCDAFHVHGWEEGETKKAHRAQHCHRKHPYDRGYFIAPFHEIAIAHLLRKQN
jgi:hypothetical protein